ncbi:unnamed protein product [Dicrocoelium dendriticum]|nr:unnamed protein product [Dicrocoelium dendriticum]
MELTAVLVLLLRFLMVTDAVIKNTAQCEVKCDKRYPIKVFPMAVTLMQIQHFYELLLNNNCKNRCIVLP